ncbi:MAG TPA: hypothetical protein VNG33_17715 [Polyangiaceae bacterium]|nr:hypothetical protein [Polyangiaceae bacterium]
MGTPLQRLNLNLPSTALQQLRRLAKAARAPEASYARTLLVEALERAEQARFRKRLAASRTPERCARDEQIVAAIERLRG